jgi:hypothetical protein
MDLNGTLIIIIYIYACWEVWSHFVYQYIYTLFDKSESNFTNRNKHEFY